MVLSHVATAAPSLGRVRRPFRLCTFAGLQHDVRCNNHARFLSVPARGGCGKHRAALARGGKRAKIVSKNSRDNSDCNFMCVCVQ